MDRLYEICDKHGLTVVEDCAHALGVNWRGTQLGNRAKVRFIQLQLRSFVKREDRPRQRCQETTIAHVHRQAGIVLSCGGPCVVI